MTDEELYTVDATHTDPTQIKTALALAVKQLARAEKLNTVLYKALVNECMGCEATCPTECNVCQTSKALSMAEGETPVLDSNAADRQLEDVLMPDKGGDK